jgi:hypothetical protein
MAPRVAVRLSRFSTIAFAGTTTEPVMRNSSTKVTSAMIAAANGRLARMLSRESTRLADGPATSVWKDAGVDRMSWTSYSRSSWPCSHATAHLHEIEATNGVLGRGGRPGSPYQRGGPGHTRAPVPILNRRSLSSASRDG